MTTNHVSPKQTISALVRDKPGVLNRISSMFRRRGFNIASLAVGHSEELDLSRMTFVVEGDDHTVEQVTKNLHKLIDVIKVDERRPPRTWFRGSWPSSSCRPTTSRGPGSSRWSRYSTAR